MKFIQGKNRNQIVLIHTCLEQAISEDNEVRVIDLFVEALDIEDYPFVIKDTKEGRPAYHPKDLLKLYIYGYMNSIRSSRKLEVECHRNIEMMWLMKELTPDHNTISNFRRDNEKAIRKVFRATVKLAQHFELIGGKLVAGDSTKLRAQNSKKNNFNPKKIERHLEYIATKLDQYNQDLAAADGDAFKEIEIKEQIAQQVERKAFYNDLTKQLEQSGETQISTSDPESRQMITRNNITEVAYNIQTTVDAKHCIPIDYKVTNENDSKAMGNMTRRTKTIFGHTNFTALYDKGYHTESEFAYADQHQVEVMVAIPNVASHAPNIAYDVEHFQYAKEQDEYTCPAGQKLTTNGRWYKKAKGKTINQVKHYKTKACLECPHFNQCTSNKNGRLIERSEHADLVAANKERIAQHKEIYRKRQLIVEHPYGTIKRQWGFCYIITKRGKKRASADVGMMFTAYNLRRIFNLIDPKVLKQYLMDLFSYIFSKTSPLHSKSAQMTIVIFNPIQPQLFSKVA